MKSLDVDYGRLKDVFLQYQALVGGSSLVLWGPWCWVWGGFLFFIFIFLAFSGLSCGMWDLSPWLRLLSSCGTRV